MIKTISLTILVAAIVTQDSCMNTAPVSSTNLPFESKPVSVRVMPGKIDEASGIAKSRTGKDFFWVEQDSGNPPEIYRLGKDGILINTVTLKGLKNRDWEDLVISGGPKTGVNYLYLAETGDNLALHNDYVIYRFPEPADNVDTVYMVDSIRFKYPGSAHDAEAILIDHQTKDIYIITKRDARSQIFRVKYPQELVSYNEAELVGELPFNGVVSAAMSPDSRDIIVKTYTKLFYWRKTASEKIEKALLAPGINLGYQAEPQGEGICFDEAGKGFYTLGEKPMVVPAVKLNYYKRR